MNPPQQSELARLEEVLNKSSEHRQQLPTSSQTGWPPPPFTHTEIPASIPALTRSGSPSSSELSSFPGTSQFNSPVLEHMISTDQDCELPTSTLSRINQIIDEEEEEEGDTGATPTKHTRRNVLNPNAPAFVPPSPAATPKSKPRRIMPSWQTHFQLGARSPLDGGAQVRQSCASAVVKSGGGIGSGAAKWKMRSVSELCQHVLWMACRPKPDHEGLPAFVVELYKQFEVEFGGDVAYGFLWQLRETLIGACRFCWEKNAPHAISYEPQVSETYVAAAQALLSFFGALYTYSITHLALPTHRPFLCVIHINQVVSTLLANLISHEHVAALRMLLQASGPTIWLPTFEKPQTTAEKVSMFQSCYLDQFSSSDLSRRSSVLKKLLGDTEHVKNRDGPIQVVKAFESEIEKERLEKMPIYVTSQHGGMHPNQVHALHGRRMSPASQLMPALPHIQPPLHLRQKQPLSHVTQIQPLQQVHQMQPSPHMQQMHAHPPGIPVRRGQFN